MNAPQTLTHSRLACFRACPRKHYLRYEIGIRREITSQPLLPHVVADHSHGVLTRTRILRVQKLSSNDRDHSEDVEVVG